jgi:glycogenin
LTRFVLFAHFTDFAWVTLATNDSYSLGALVVAHSLKRVSTAHQLAVLITPGVSDSMRSKLQDAFDVVQLVNVLDSGDATNLAVLKRPELGITFTKLHCWNLTQFDKCVFLDADVLVRLIFFSENL